MEYPDCKKCGCKMDYEPKSKLCGRCNSVKNSDKPIFTQKEIDRKRNTVYRDAGYTAKWINTLDEKAQRIAELEKMYKELEDKYYATEHENERFRAVESGSIGAMAMAFMKYEAEIEQLKTQLEQQYGPAMALIELTEEYQQKSENTFPGNHYWSPRFHEAIYNLAAVMPLPAAPEGE